MKMRRTEIVSDDITLFQIFCPRLSVRGNLQGWLQKEENVKND